MNYAVEELKKKAAAICTSGVLVSAVGEKGSTWYRTFIPNATGGGFFVGDSVSAQAISVEAIFVKQ